MKNKKHIPSLHLLLLTVVIAVAFTTTFPLFALSSVDKNQAPSITGHALSPQSKFGSKITFNQAKDALKGVVPYKGYELRIEIPDGFVCNSSDIADIKQNLAGRNWFWRQAGEAVQGRAVERIRILLDKLSTIQELDTFRELVGGRRVVAIYTAGSYPWHDKPGDIDIHFIVEGERPWEKRELTPEEAKAVGITVAGSGRAMGKIALQIFGIADLKRASQDEDLGDDGDLQRKLLTIYGNAVHLGGLDLFEKSAPPPGDFRILAFHLRELANVSQTIARKEKRLLEAKAIESAFGFSPLDVWDAIHINELLRKFRRNKALEGQGRASLLKIGENFLPSALLNEDQRTALLGAVDYDEIAGDASNAADAKNTSVTLNCMDGGLGLATRRERYLEETAKRVERDPKTGKVQLGAKGTDLFFKVKGEFVSIAEIKLLHAIAHASDFGEAVFQPLVNGDSAKSYEALLDSPYFLDKIAKGKTPKRTYRQVIKEKGLRLMPGKDNEMPSQSDLPVIDLENGELTEKYTAPGGHGQWGVRLLYEALRFQEPDDGRVHIRAFYNGDNIASFADRNIVGWMARNRIPIVMASTTKAGLDRKGGQIGIQRLEDGTLRVQMLEVAQAKKVDKSSGNAKREHERLFYAIGLPGLSEVKGRDILGADPEKPHAYTNKTGEQFFNTNVAFINYSVLAPILQKLASLEGVEFEGEKLSGEALIERIISPALIENVKKKNDNKNYTQLEGAIGSCFLNLATFFSVSKDERVQGILRKHLAEGGRLLRIVNVKPDKRTKLFTPVKTSFDYWFQAHSDYYRLDTEDWTLADVEGGIVPPEVEFSDTEAEDYYTDVQSCIDALGNASTRGLTYLHIEGRVLLKDAVLKGRVEIMNNSPAMVDLNNPAMRRELGMPEEGPLILNNVTIKIPEGAYFLANLRKNSKIRGYVTNLMAFCFGQFGIGRDEVKRMVEIIAGCHSFEEAQLALYNAGFRWGEAGNKYHDIYEGYRRDRAPVVKYNTLKDYIRTGGFSKDSVVIDIGCGNHSIGKRMVDSMRDERVPEENIPTVIGVDLGPDPQIKDPKIAYIQQDAKNPGRVPVEGAEVADRIWIIAALHHMPEGVMGSILKEAHRLLKPNGELVVFEDVALESEGPKFDEEGLAARQLADLSDEERRMAFTIFDWHANCVIGGNTFVPITGNYYPADKWRKVFSAAGFKVEGAHYIGVYKNKFGGVPHSVFVLRKDGKGDAQPKSLPNEDPRRGA